MELLKLTLAKNFTLNLYCNAFLWIPLLIIFVIVNFYLYKNKHIFFKKSIEIDEYELGIGNNKIKIKPNYQTIQVAYKLWVELTTRKLGLLIDEDNDVISEIYDSWYSFFTIARELIKEIPAHQASNKDTKELIIISTKILNDAVRPHLTKWQARYREWYRRYTASIEVYDISPQKIQKKFKCQDFDNCYEMLVADMKEVNKKLIYYKSILEDIIFNKKF